MKTINSFSSKLFAITFSLMASVSSFAYEFVFVNDFHIDGFAYKIIDRTEPCAVALIEVADCEKHVAIPESVAYNDTTFVVTTLGMGDIVFTGIAQKTMESLYIPKTIMIVNYHALGGCPNLMSIVVDEENKYLDSRNNCNAIISSDDTYRPANHLVAGCKTTVIPNSVTEIGNYAFVRCETLEDIIIPEGVTTINDGAFYECSSLSSIKLPESLIKLPQVWIFSGCTSLKEVFFFAKTPPCIAYGMFHGINPTIYVPKESLDAYENVLCWRYFDIQAIPDSMYFADDHFVKDSIHYHILNDTIAPFEVEVTYTWGAMDNMSQKNYTELTEANIPATVEYKGKVFNVTRIGEWAFGWANKLQRVTMGDNIKVIDRFAIVNCSQLKEVQIGEQVDSILLDAFSYGKLETISIPKNVKYIAPLIVRNNPIKSIVVDPDNVNYTSVDGVLFNKQENILHSFPAAKATEYVIPETVDTIGSCAFANAAITSVIFPKTLVYIEPEAFVNTKLTKVDFPSTLMAIGMTAFDMCSGITEVTCRATTPPIMSDGQEESNTSVFLRVPIANATLYVPAESVEAYKSASQWKDFGQILPIEPTSYKSQWCDTWNVMWFDGLFFDETASTSQYRLGKDTIIGDYTYSKFTSRTSVRFTDDRKVYVYYEGFDDNDPYSEDLPTGEYLAYDFSAQVGDTLEVFSGVTYNTKTYKCVVYDVQTDLETNLLTIKLHPLVVVDGNGNVEVSSEEITWIEGVGSPRGFLIGTTLPGGGLYTLLCAYNDDELKYTGDLYDEYGCEYNAGPFNEKLLGTWRVVGGNEIISISDSIIVFIGLTQKYTASATQLTVERLWIPEEESYRWANCNYTLSNDTLWIDNFMPLLVATYPPTFGPITLVKVKHEDLFPTLWGLQRTSFTEYFDSGHQPESEPVLLQAGNIKEIGGKLYLDFGQYLREENGKIYIYSELLQKDFVLYDFTLELGDTLTTLNWDYNNPNSDGTISVVDYAVDCPIDTLIVTDISTITLLDGKEYKKWIFNHGYFGYVESIGTLSGLFYELSQSCMVVPGCYMGDHLVCASRNGKLLYQMDDAEMERLGAECLCDVEKKWSDTWCDTWNIMEHNVQLIGDYNEETWRHYLAEDTTINGTTYTTVNRYWTADKTKRGFVATIRFTEDQKVYALLGDTEYLVYDFSVQVGDTIETIVGVNCGTMLQQLLVHQVDIDDATNRKTITLYPLCQLEEDVDCDRCDENGYYWDLFPIQWIEGVGSTDGFLMGDRPCSDWVGGIGHKLLCAYKDDELQYINDLYQDEYGCEYNAVEQNPEDLFPTLWGLQRTICNEYCEDSKTSLQKFDEILFEHDKPYIYCESAFLIREENNKILIYSHSLDKDLVLYDFTLEVGDSLPRLYLDESAEKDLYWIYYNIMNVVDYHKDLEGNILPADTLIVTDVSAITLLDGKEYKKWTFNNGMEYVEGIGSFGNNMRFFDFFQLIGNMAVPVSLHGTHLVCASKNGKLLYQMDEAEMERLGAECLCDYDRGPRKDNAKDGQIGGRPTPTQWNQLELDLREMENGTTILRAETFSYTLENDSVVANGKIFYQLARQSTKDTATTKSFVGALHFGEDEDNRVYFLRDGVEYVLYDFTAEPGDTVEIFAGINNYPQETTYTHVVVDKDTTEDGACRMFLEVVCPEDTTTATNAEKVWLAGLGSVDGIVHNAAKRTSNAHAAPSRTAHSSDTQTSVMLCAWRDDNCLYTTDHPDYDTLGCVYNIDEMTAIEDIHTSPSYQKLLRDGQLFIIHEGKTYNVMGIAVE